MSATLQMDNGQVDVSGMTLHRSICSIIINNPNQYLYDIDSVSIE